MMKTIYHAANSRGHANYGWLKSNHTFSFANYYNRDRMHFGVLRVLNDDHVEGVWIHQDAWFHLALAIRMYPAYTVSGSPEMAFISS